MTARFPPPREEGLHTLAPELIRIIEALARVVEERDYCAASAETVRLGAMPRGHVVHPA